MRLSIFKPASAAIVVVTGLSAALIGCASSPPARFITDDGQFTPCDSAPHCVSSQAPADSDKYIAPFGYTTSTSIARSALIATLSRAPRATLVTREPQFVHATFKSRMGFVDDVTFLIQPDDKIIDVKSSSRLGYSDLGVNRKRVERLRQDFDAELAAKQPE